MLKFVLWVLNGTNRHRANIRLYEKNVTGRIIAVLIGLLMVAASFGLEYWFFSFLRDLTVDTDNGFIVLLGIGLLAVAVLLAAFDYCAVFCYVAFRNAFFGTVLKVAERVDGNTGDGAEIIEDAESEIRMAHPALDVFLCVVCAALTVACVVSVFILLNGIIHN